MLEEKIYCICKLFEDEDYNPIVPDWNKIEEKIIGLGEEINDIIGDEYDKNSTLSQVFMYLNTVDGEDLTRLTELFLKHGFNVSKNNGFNGYSCLLALCYSTYDKYVIRLAKLLLAEGADPNHTEINEDGDEENILWTISGKFSYWDDIDDDYEDEDRYDGRISANMFEAYYEMMEAAMNGEEYHVIEDVTEVIGMKVDKAELLGERDTQISDIGFPDKEFKPAIVLWFGGKPLVCDRRLEYIVNPLRVKQSLESTDVTEIFSPIIGKKLIDFRYTVRNAARFTFEDGTTLDFSNNWYTSSEENIKMKFKIN